MQINFNEIFLTSRKKSPNLCQLVYYCLFLSDYNIAIEYQGEQHFTAIEKFGGKKDFEIRIKRDNIKKELCEKYNIPIIYLRGKIVKEQLIKQINETSKTKEI